MLLFRFGFKRVAASEGASTSERHSEPSVPSYLPTRDESGLGRMEFEDTISRVSDLSDPATKKRKTRGKYTQYTPEQRASIGKFALENGNERARRHFLSDFPDRRVQ